MKLNFQLWNLFIELLAGMWLVRWNLDLHVTLTMIQATMSKVTEDVSCCSDKCIQALEAHNFSRDVVQTFL